MIVKIIAFLIWLIVLWFITRFIAVAANGRDGGGDDE